MDALKFAQHINRRDFLQRTGCSLGAAALGLLGAREAAADSAVRRAVADFAPRAKRVIYLFQSGAPTQLETFDYKPGLRDLEMTELPDSIRMGQRLTGMTANQDKFPVVSSRFKFAQHGQNGAWISELLPYTAGIVDDIAIVRSVYTEAINHDPAITFCQTGSQLAGRPSMGAWVAYGLGTANENLPTFTVMISRGTGRLGTQPLYDRLWGSGMLPSRYQGVKLRAGEEPVLYLANPAGCDTQTRRQMLDQLRDLNQHKYNVAGDPEILTRIEQYELAFRMQAAVPDLTDISDEPDHILDLYGPDVHKPGTYARNCLLARRMVERDVRFVQLYHMGWDHHDNLPDHLSKQCRDTDQPSAALVADLKQRGLLDETLVIWGGEFGRTVYSQGKVTDTTYGRDHHPRCFSLWMAGGGIKPGLVYGTTDDFSYNIVENPVHVNDLHATILHCLGLNHERLAVKHQGLDVRLSGVEERHPVKALLA
ncbi:MAG: DUF1501 domain-containing protein [Candidatus Hydrogenedentes bacterium]|nr:DUF1501 domain-containing protein [Candidatus Hydrogenedentota bacterium]